MANGILVWPVLLFGALGLRADLRLVGILALSGAVVIAAWFLVPGSSGNAERTITLLDRLPSIGMFALSYLSGPIGTTSRLAGILAAAVALSAVLWWNCRFLLRRGFSEPATLTLLITADFIVATAFVTAAGRALDEWLPNPVPRYWLPSMVFWCSALILAASGEGAAGLTRGVRAGVIGALVALVMAAVVKTHFVTIEVWRGQVDNAWAADAAVAVGAEDTDQFRAIYPWSGRVQQLRPEIEARHILTFSPSRLQIAGHRFERERIDALPVCRGVITGATALPTLTGQPLTARIKGWVDAAAELGRRPLAVIDGTGTVIGEGVVHALVTTDGTGVVRQRITAYAAYDLPGTRYSDLLALRPDGEPACRIDAAGELPGFRTVIVPPTDLREELGSVAAIDGHWAVGGYSAAVGRPPVPAVIYGSWVGADSDTGILRIGPFSLPDGESSFGLLAVVGPTAEKLSLRLLDEHDVVVNAVDLTEFSSHNWLAARVMVPAGTKGPLILEARDADTAWGSWFAVSAPHRLEKR
jgi:hypothetical protein